ncbi:serine protease, partial [bacterium]|nr:serine protease [bacterium]
SFLQVETPLPRPAPLFEGTVDGEEPAVIIGGDESGKNAFYFGKFNREGDKFVYITTCATGGDSGGPLFLRNTEGKLGLAGVLKGQDFVEGNAGYTKFVDFAKEIFDGKITEPKKIIELSSGNKRGEALSLGLQAEGGVMYGFVKNEVTFPVSLNGSLDLIDSYYGDTFSAALNLKFQTDWQMIFSGLGVSCAFPLQGGNDFKQHIILDAYAGINFEGGMVYDAFLGYEFAPDSAPSSRLEMFLRLGAYGIYFQEKMYDDFSYDIKGMLTAGIRLF